MRPFDGDGKRRGQWQAAPFQDIYRELSLPCSQHEPQDRRGRFASRFRRPERKHEAGAGLCRHCQPPQLRVAGPRQPQEQGLEAARTQCLLRRPQRIPPSRGTDHRQLLQAHASGPQCGRIRQVRGSQPGDPVARRRQRGKRRQHDLQLANAFGMAKGLGKPAYRPAAAGKFGIKPGIAGRNSRFGGYGRGNSAAPDGLPLDDFCKSGHRYCIFIQYQAVWQALPEKPATYCPPPRSRFTWAM